MPDEEELQQHKAPLRSVHGFCRTIATPSWLHLYEDYAQVLFVLGLVNRAITPQFPGLALHL